MGIEERNFYGAHPSGEYSAREAQRTLEANLPMPRARVREGGHYMVPGSSTIKPDQTKGK